jgi:enolase-phosphatase E1
MPTYVLTDIEGTTTPIAFVHDVLFPYSYDRLPQFVDDPATLEQMRQWIREDKKEPALKELQGRIWRQGYEDGTLRSQIYDDVRPALERWKARGLTLGVYSSGSVEAQHLLFRYTERGDLTPYFSDYFDTKVGAKREEHSYRAILSAIGRAGDDVLFLSDVPAELDAARAAGIKTAQLVRPGTAPVATHPGARDFGEVDRLL